MKKDFINFAFSLWRIKYFIKFSQIIFIKVYRAIFVRYLRGYLINYPSDIKNLVKKIPKTKLNRIDEPKTINNIKQIKLAAGIHKFKDWPNWKKNFNSHEQYVSIHRWNWLIYEASKPDTKVDYDWGINMVRSWFHDMGILPNGAASESYTLGERISNICLFTREMTGNWDQVPKDLKQAIKYMAEYLAYRLEYLPGNLTGNHIINNARALLFAGHVSGSDELIVLSRRILEQNLGILVNQNGFLREGSSHYQFLFTRWILEIYLISSERNDHETFKVIKPFIQKTLSACNFFTVKSQNDDKLFPLFGDISPDCEPKWLVNLTNSQLVPKSKHYKNNKYHGWENLFKNFIFNKNFEYRYDYEQKYSSDFRDEGFGWYRLDLMGWTAIWHAESSKGPPIASHSHHDFCSLVLYRNGKEIIIDSGRFDYEDSDISNYGLSSSAHSSVNINGYPIMLSTRDNLFTDDYRKSEVSVKSIQSENKFTLIIEHNGFKRFSNNLSSHKRAFIFSNNEVTITDYFDGIGSFKMESSFQFCRYTEYDILCSSANLESSKTIFMASESPVAGWRSKSFGKKDASLTKVYKAIINIPTTIEYKVYKNNS